MNEHTRRTFLISTGAAAAVGTAAASAGPAAAAAAIQPAASSKPASDEPARTGEPVVAYVSDAATGQVTVMRGDEEVVLTDHALARRLSGEVR